MLNNTNNKPIDIGILEISTPNKAILEFFFDSAGETLYKEARINDASAFIIDYDFPGAKESWKDIFESTGKPGIIISIHEVDLPSTVWIPKPLTSKNLIQAALKIRALLKTKSAPEPTTPIEKASARTEEVSAKQALPNTASTKIETKEHVGLTANKIAPAASSSYVEIKPDNTPIEKAPKPIEKKPIANEAIDSHDSEIDALLNSLMKDNASKGIHQAEEPKENVKAAKQEAIKPAFKTAEKQAEPRTKPIEFSLEELPTKQNSKAAEEITSVLKTIETTEETPAKKNTYVVENEKSSADLELFDHSSKEEASNITAAVVDEFGTSVEDFVVEDIVDEVAKDIIIDEKSLSASTAPTKILGQETVAPKKLKTSIVEDSKSPDDELQSLLEEIRQEAETDPTAEPGNSKKRFNTVAEKRWYLTCGDTNNPTNNVKNNTFNIDDQILSTFLRVLEQSKISKNVMRLKFKGVIIVIDPEVDNVYCDISLMDDGFAQVCFEPIDKASIKIHSLDKSEVRLYRKKIQTSPKNSHSIESFIWTMSLLSSRGRLPHGTNINQKLGLKYWPNLTRLEPIPHMMQISAVFKKHSGSLTDIAKWLSIPQAYVYAYYNAVLALELIEDDKKKLNSLKSINQANEKGKGKNRGLFSRLLKRITK